MIWLLIGWVVIALIVSIAIGRAIQEMKEMNDE